MPLKSWKQVFLAALAESPNVSRAARAADVDRSHAYECRESDPAFARAWDDAIRSSVDDVEEAAFARARMESDTLAIFLLKCHRPEVYNRPQQVQLSGPAPTPHAIPDADPRELAGD